jgi:hypothetical protein
LRRVPAPAANFAPDLELRLLASEVRRNPKLVFAPAKRVVATSGVPAARVRTADVDLGALIANSLVEQTSNDDTGVL